MDNTISNILLALGENPKKPPIRYTEDMVNEAYTRNIGMLVSIFPHRFTKQRQVKLQPGAWQNVGNCFISISSIVTQNDKDGNVIKYLQASTTPDTPIIDSNCNKKDSYKIDAFYIEPSSSNIFQVVPAVPCDVDVWVTIIGVLDVRPMIDKIEKNNSAIDSTDIFSLKMPADLASIAWYATMGDLLGLNINSSVALNQAKLYYDKYDKTLAYIIQAERRLRKGR